MSVRPHQAFALQGTHLAVSLSARCPYVYVRDKDRWALVAVGDRSGGGGEIEALADPPPDTTYDTVERNVEKRELRLSGSHPELTIETRLSLPGDGHVLRFETRVRTRRPLPLLGLRSTLWFVPAGVPLSSYGHPDELFVPFLRPQAEHLLPVPVLRSRTIVVGHGRIGVELRPGIAEGPLAPFVDFDLTDARRNAPRLSFGVGRWQPDGEGRFEWEPGRLEPIPADSVLHWSAELMVRSFDTGRRAIATAARAAWRRRPSPAAPGALACWEDVARAEIPRALARKSVDGEKLSGTFGRSADDPSIPFEGGVNALRAAFAIALWSDRVGTKSWRSAAKALRRFFLAAPTRSGCVPSSWSPDDDWGGASGRYALGDMTASALAGLAWHRQAGGSNELLRMARALGEFLVASQRPSGAIPAFFDVKTLRPSGELREDAPTAWGAHLLAELGRESDGGAFVRASRRAATFLVHEVVPARAWTEPDLADLPVDRRSGMPSQGTSSLLATIDTLRSLYEVTGEDRLLEAALEAADALAMAQQVEHRDDLSIDVFGGFGPSNATAGWSDVISASAAETFLRLYLLTGESELFERGSAALASVLPVLAHADDEGAPVRWGTPEGADASGPRAGFAATTGRALAAAASVRDGFGDVYVDGSRAAAFGIDACRVKSARDGGRLVVEVANAAGRAREVDFVVDGGDDDLTWNGFAPEAKRSGGRARFRATLESGEAGELVVPLAGTGSIILR